jgi:hypothetical protein
VRIDSYRFGRIVVDGRPYGRDLLIVDGSVRSPWWRSAGGHVFAPEDLEAIVDAAPAHVVLGTGYFGRVEVLDSTHQTLAGLGCEVHVARSRRAVEIFNHLAASGENVAAGLHLTC